MVGKGEAEIGMTQISEILPVAGAELAGPAAAGAPALHRVPGRNPRAAHRKPRPRQALLRFLRSPEAAKVIRAHGLEPAA